jgi:hypothetical protein
VELRHVEVKHNCAILPGKIGVTDRETFVVEYPTVSQSKSNIILGIRPDEPMDWREKN